MSRQAEPSAEQRCHCRVSTTIPLQLPSSAVSVSPAIAVPLTVGAVSALGGGGGSATGAAAGAATTSEAAEAARPLANVSVALTTTRTVEPTSSAPSRYVAPVASAMSRHVVPSAEQRCHCR